ncbi:hypothetical protein G6F56_010947 [Rhizopus delemar]|nr:hypothetical protein G6F56_010947 [Rhizopus delemar]
MISATDYIYECGIQMFKSVLLFKNATFAATEDVTITLEQKNGILISDVLPQNYQSQYTTTYCHPLLNRDLLSSNSYAQNLVQLFNFNQLQLVHSKYFGPKGVQEGSLTKHPFLNAKFKALLLSKNKKPDIEPYVMEMALSKYSTNFKNIHPIETRGTSIPYDKISVAGLTYNAHKKLLKNERKRREKYYNKALNDPENKEKWGAKAERSRERTFTYVHLLNSQRQPSTRKLFRTVTEKEIDLEIASDTFPVASQQLMEVDNDPV